MTSLNIIMDTKETRKSLSLLGKSQYPFALAKSLTLTAVKAQERVKRITENKFNIRSKFILKGIKIIPSKKADVKRGIANAAVFTDDKIVNPIVGHEGGQTRRSRKSKLLAIPSRTLKKQNFRTASGRVKKKFRPSVLLKGKGTSRGGANQSKRSGQRKATLIEIDSNLSLIVRRKSPKNSIPLDILWILKRSVKIDKRWTFEKQVNVSVKLNFKRIFEKEMNRAIATAR